MKKRSVLLAAVAMMGFYLTAQTKWTQLSKFPEGRAGHSFFTIGEKAYLCGGNNGTSKTNSVFKYDIKTDSWDEALSMPIKRAGGVAFTINGIGYVTLGGSNSMQAYNPTLNSWISKAEFPSNDRTESAVFIIGNEAFVGLGQDESGIVYSDFYKYNSVEYRWTRIRDFPTKRTNACAFSVNEKGFVGTGLISWNNALKVDLWEYNPLNDVWTSKASLPGDGRYASLGFSINGKGYLGTGEKSNPSALLNDIWEYNPNNDSWKKFENYPGGGVNYAEAFTINNEVYIGGGSPGWRADFFKLTSCPKNLEINPRVTIADIGASVRLEGTNLIQSSIFSWQTDFGQGFQTLIDFGSYSGTKTSSILISNLQIHNHNQPFRVVSQFDICSDTSDIAKIIISDTCIQYISDTTFITVTDTLLINTAISGVGQPDRVNTIKIFPNPASTHITIDYGNVAILSGYRLRITNSLGQEVFQTAITQPSEYLDLSGWGGNGLYFVYLIDPQGNILDIRKIVLR